ncbi:MAG: lasso peptide biosynthesis B2 protein [Bacteroidota bacterium]
MPQQRRALRYILQRLRSLTGAEWKHLLTALWLIPAVRLALSAFPFKSMLRFIDELDPAKQEASPAYVDGASWALALMARTLLGDKPCLTQALALQILLRRRAIPSTLRIGVKRDEQGGLAAHAWLEREERVLIGGADSPKQYALLQSPDQYGGALV